MRAQAEYFDDSRHRFTVARLLEPDLACRLEMASLDRHLTVARGATLMDVGCGNGRASLHYLRAGFDVIAVDVSEGSLRELREIYRCTRKASWGRLSTRTTLPESGVDGIVGADVLHHVDVGALLPRLYTCLKPGGGLAFSEPNGFYPAWYLYLLVKRIPWRIERGITKCMSWNLVRLLRSAGFSDIQLDGHGVLPTRLFNAMPAFAYVNAVVPEGLPILTSCAFRLIVAARKPSVPGGTGGTGPL